MIKNTSGQAVSAQLVAVADGEDVTSGTTTVYVTGDAGTQASGGGTVTHEGNGCWSYQPTQAETNYNHVSYTFVNSSAVSVTIQRDPVTLADYKATGFSTLDAAGVRTAVGLASANLDTQLGDIPTTSEFEARTLAAADYFDPAADTVASVTLVATCTNNTDMRGTDSASTHDAAAVVTALGDGSSLTALATTAALAVLDGIADAIKAKTDNLPTDPADQSLIIAATDAITSAIAALEDISVTDILTTQMTESYAATGVAPTLAQSLFWVQQVLTELSFSGTTGTVKKLDGSTTAGTLTLDDADDPTSLTRAT
jgi:hypothetical protein